jgi:hypothetical protein
LTEGGQFGFFIKGQMPKYIALILAVITAWCFVFTSQPVNSFSQEQTLTANLPREKGWATLSGVLLWVEPDYSSATREKQLVLVDASQDKTILIGEGVNKLLDQAGKEVVLTGVYKPAMMIKGKLTTVLEVRSIDRINTQSKKDEKKS